jgi:hypothetical protein
MFVLKLNQTRKLILRSWLIYSLLLLICFPYNFFRMNILNNIMLKSNTIRSIIIGRMRSLTPFLLVLISDIRKNSKRYLLCS